MAVPRSLCRMRQTSDHPMHAAMSDGEAGANFLLYGETSAIQALKSFEACMSGLRLTWCIFFFENPELVWRFGSYYDRCTVLLHSSIAFRKCDKQTFSTLMIGKVNAHTGTTGSVFSL
jgi:hypothetical protein